MNYQFETIQTPAGAFIGWADQPGQVVTGKVMDYDAARGQNFAGERCPQIVLELVEAAASVNKAGERTDFQAGEMVTITAGQANLRRGVLAADLSRGDVVRISHTSNQKTANGTVKIFEIAVARGAAPVAPAAPEQSVQPAQQQAQPPAPFAPQQTAKAPF